jgi:hypothetical protein
MMRVVHMPATLVYRQIAHCQPRVAGILFSICGSDTTLTALIDLGSASSCV